MINAIKQYFCKLKLSTDLTISKMTDCHPAQYIIKYCDFPIAYVHVRHGLVRVLYTPTGVLGTDSFIIYYKKLRNPYQGSLTEKEYNQIMTRIKYVVASRIIFENQFDDLRGKF